MRSTAASSAIRTARCATAASSSWHTGLDAQAREQAELFIDLLLKANERMNLTAVRNRDDALWRHVGDSLALIPVLDAALAVRQRPQIASHVTAGPSAQPAPAAGPGRDLRDSSGPTQSPIAQHAARAGKPLLKLIDVGSGAGLPGVILALARPQWQVTCLDSIGKRCDFVRDAVWELALPNVDTLWSRAEVAAQLPKHREAYHVAIARAVAETRLLAEYCLPFVSVGGLWVAAKGPSPEAEVAAAEGALQQLGGSLQGIYPVDSFSEDGQRTAVVVSKFRPTPALYPRQAGTPKRKPL